MDPTACLEEMAIAWQENSTRFGGFQSHTHNEIHDMADNLITWLSKGGAMPKISRDTLLRILWSIRERQ